MIGKGDVAVVGSVESFLSPRPSPSPSANATSMTAMMTAIIQNVQVSQKCFPF